MKTLEAALLYREKYGFSVIPIRPGDKRPLIPWEEFQKRRADADEIKSWFRQEPRANLGIVTGEISGIGVIDIDTEEGQRNIDSILPDSFVTPMQHTPRGGKHLFCSYNALLRNNTNTIRGADFRGEGGFVAVSPSKNEKGVSYRWDSDINLDNTPLAPIPQEYIDAVLSSTCRSDVAKRLPLSSPVVMFQKGNRDNDLFHVANYLVKSRMPIEEIEQVLQVLAENCNPPFNQNEISIKIKSALQRADRRERNLASEVKEWVLSSNGVFLSSEVSKCLHLSSREEQKNLSKVLSRLCKDSVIEKYGNKNGCYRVIDTDLEEIDIFDADITPLKIRWPLGVENFVQTHPKQLIVIAGEPNAGKSAFLLNVAAMNRERMPVHYFSSEMGKAELKIRCQMFDNIPFSEWKKVRFYERADNFADVLKPDALNIVDFLEIHDEFYKMGGMMKEIFDKLRNGIAVIAIQKPKGRDEGLGGQRGLEKPRLYMSMAAGELKIIKGKNWASPTINPNGMLVNWKLAAGCKFIQEGQWHA